MPRGDRGQRVRIDARTKVELERLQPLRVADLHAAEALAPRVHRLLADTVLLRDLADGCPLGLAKHLHPLLVREPALAHCALPVCRGARLLTQPVVRNIEGRSIYRALESMTHRRIDQLNQQPRHGRHANERGRKESKHELSAGREAPPQRPTK